MVLSRKGYLDLIDGGEGEDKGKTKRRSTGQPDTAATIQKKAFSNLEVFTGGEALENDEPGHGGLRER